MKIDKRHVIQFISAILSNANLKGFREGSIWQGKSKFICVPGLNCYSCPGAVGACPIGSLQALLSGDKKGIPYYIVGILILFGVIFGRVICGFLCLFGYLQDLLYKIKTPKLTIPERVDKPLRFLKYIILAVFVIGLPLLVTGAFGIGDPWFCKYICPAGTLEGGIPLMIQNKTLRSMVGFLFSWKMFLLVVTIVSSMLIYRPFCKYICPLGAIYGLFNRYSFIQMQVDQDACIHCGKCTKTCKMQVDVIENINSAECIRCGDCKKACPAQAIHTCMGNRKSKTTLKNVKKV
ncbi:MAG: 4Fe-4S binding protein [Clostridia bacterium]|nr:4Fe-4S binding protein [Clostridia bacterium]NCC42601.1 4Fe-4S binding protein [Clostridia bacterium]